MYTENYETMLRELKEAPNKWRDIPYLWIGRLKIVDRVKIFINTEYFSISQLSPKLPVVSTISLTKGQRLSVETDKLILKFICKCYGTRRAQMIWEEKKEGWEVALPNFKTYSQHRT